MDAISSTTPDFVEEVEIMTTSQNPDNDDDGDTTEEENGTDYDDAAGDEETEMVTEYEEEVSIPQANPSLARKRGKRKAKYTIKKFVSQDKKDLKSLSEQMGDVVNVVVKSAKGIVPTIVKSCGADSHVKNQVLEVAHDMVFSVVQAQEQLEAVPGIVNKVYLDMGLDKLDEDGQSLSTLELLEMLDKFGEKATKAVEAEQGGITKAHVVKNPLYQNALGELNKLEAAGERSTRASSSSTQAHSEEGFEALTPYVPTNDPITRQPFKNIRVNVHCKHVYEYDTITAMMISSGTRAVMCPYPACLNKKPLVLNDIVEDEEMARKIAEHIQESRL